jgi:NAD(P)-dependent dehydrogenase (short-subunit alcohol dehydrogenase family)
MALRRRAALLAPGATVEQAAAKAFETLGYAFFTVSTATLEERIESGGLEPAMAELLAGEPAIVVTGDEIFPDLEDEDSSLSVGLRRAFMACRIVTRSMMRTRFGRVVGILPPLGRSSPGHAAVLGAMGGLMKSLAREVGTRGITANVISPGYFEIDQPKLPPYLAVGRLSKPSDLAAAIGFLVSEEAGYVTGQEITVDGGLKTA